MIVTQHRTVKLTNKVGGHEQKLYMNNILLYDLSDGLTERKSVFVGQADLTERERHRACYCPMNNRNKEMFVLGQEITDSSGL
jgi:hypothetical protein